MNKKLEFIFLILTILSAHSVQANEMLFQEWKKDVVKSNFSGVVLVAKGNDVVFKEAFGIANREENIPFSVNTIFDIGSLTKQFTATAILKLQETNRLSINDPITKFFTNVPDDKKDITIHQLLTHTAGFELIRGNGSSDIYELVSKDVLVEFAFKSKLLSPPGEKYSYSNIGYSLLAIIIEKITKDDYEVYFRDNLFKPALLQDTGYRLTNRVPKKIAINYGADQTTLQKIFFITAESKSVGNPFKHLELDDGPRFNLEGGGGLSSTIEDLYRWHLALNSNLILSAQSKHELFSPHNISLNTKSKSHYGYGWLITLTERGTTHAEHNGSNGYSFADMHRFIEDNVLVIIATNDRDVYPQSIMNNLIEIVEESMANKSLKQDK